MNTVQQEPATTQQAQPGNRKPNKWLAALLGLFFPTIAQLYVAQPAWAAVYFVAFWTMSVGFAASHAPAAAPAKALLMVVIGVGCAVQAYRFAVRYPADKPHPRYSRWFGALGVLLLILIPSGIVMRIFVIEPFSIPSAAMLPTVAPGHYIMVRKWSYGHYSLFGAPLVQGGMSAEVRRGDMIVFDDPENPRVRFVKRVIALPGDKLVYRDDKTLAINDTAVPQRPEGEYNAVSGDALQHFSRLGETLDGTEYEVLVKPDAPWVYRDAAFTSIDGCAYDDHALTCTVPQGQYFVLGDNRDNSRDSRYWGFVPADHIVGKVVSIW